MATTRLSATFANGASQSAGVALQVPFDTGGRIAPVLMLIPAGFVGDNIALDVSVDGTTWWPRHDRTGTEASYPVGPGRAVSLPLEDTMGSGWVRLRSRTGTTAAIQTAARTVTLSCAMW